MSNPSHTRLAEAASIVGLADRVTRVRRNLHQGHFLRRVVCVLAVSR
jgi:hypothetical protein